MSELVQRRADRDERMLDPRLWEAVGRLVAGAADIDSLRAHRLELLAIRERRRQGLIVPAELLPAARTSAAAALAVPRVLERVRAACEGPIVILKGPEVAAWYPHPSLRAFNDLDLWVPAMPAVQDALLAAGFRPVQDGQTYRSGSHHLRPLHLEGAPLFVEVHSRPKWVDGGRPPTLDEILAAAVDSAVEVEGVHAPCPTHHAVLLAVHAWSHAPLGRLRDVIDIAAVRQACTAAEAGAVAERWGVNRIWGATERARAALLEDAPAPWTLRTWARHLPRVRERTVLESHLERWLAGFSSAGARGGTAAALAAIGKDLRPYEGESWSRKLRRSQRAVRNAFAHRSRHESQLEQGEEPE